MSYGFDEHKQKIDVIPASLPHIIETYDDGSGGGYRLYSDGWCEQWGRYNDNDAHDYTVTFYKPFTNTLYRPIVGQQLGNGGSTQYRTYNIYTLSTGSMVVHNATNANTNYCIWYCSGFVSLT